MMLMLKIRSTFCGGGASLSTSATVTAGSGAAPRPGGAFSAGTLGIFLRGLAVAKPGMGQCRSIADAG